MRMATIQRWDELERGVATPAYRLPQKYTEALRLAADLAENNEKLQLENSEMKPKADFVDDVFESQHRLSLSQSLVVS